MEGRRKGRAYHHLLNTFPKRIMYLRFTSHFCMILRAQSQVIDVTVGLAVEIDQSWVY